MFRRKFGKIQENPEKSHRHENWNPDPGPKNSISQRLKSVIFVLTIRRAESNGIKHGIKIRGREIAENPNKS